MDDPPDGPVPRKRCFREGPYCGKARGFRRGRLPGILVLSRFLPRVPPAVHNQRRPGDEAAGGGAEKNAGADELFHPAEAAYLDAAAYFFTLILPAFFWAWARS